MIIDIKERWLKVRALVEQMRKLKIDLQTSVRQVNEFEKKMRIMQAKADALKEKLSLLNMEIGRLSIPKRRNKKNGNDTTTTD
jgi:uncharacterized protein YlxW (UPF0749 family)